MSKLTVLDPRGFPPEVTARGLNDGIGPLDSQKIFLVDVGFENSNVFMGHLKDWFAEHHPTTRTEVVRWKNQHYPDPDLCRRIRAEGSAAILGVGL